MLGKNKRGDITPSLSVIIALIILLLGLAFGYTLLKDYIDPLITSKLGSLFAKAKFE